MENNLISSQAVDNFRNKHPDISAYLNSGIPDKAQDLNFLFPLLSKNRQDTESIIQNQLDNTGMTGMDIMSLSREFQDIRDNFEGENPEKEQSIEESVDYDKIFSMFRHVLDKGDQHWPSMQFRRRPKYPFEGEIFEDDDPLKDEYLNLQQRGKKQYESLVNRLNDPKENIRKQNQIKDFKKWGEPSILNLILNL